MFRFSRCDFCACVNQSGTSTLTCSFVDRRNPAVTSRGVTAKRCSRAGSGGVRFIGRRRDCCQRGFCAVDRSSVNGKKTQTERSKGRGDCESSSTLSGGQFSSQATSTLPL